YSLLVFFLLLFLTIRRPPSTTLFPYTTLFRSGAERVFQVMDEVPETERADAVPMKEIKGYVKLSHVNFGYRPGQPILRDISLEADRKSTRLNSSHVSISYAVFCLKKKKKTKQH